MTSSGFYAAVGVLVLVFIIWRWKSGKMGKNKKSHAAKVLARNERARQVATTAGVKALNTMGHDKKVSVLEESVASGGIKARKIKEALAKNAPVKMREGADKLAKKGKEITVDELLHEYRKDKHFQQMAAAVGLDEQYFINLAEMEIRRRNGAG